MTPDEVLAAFAGANELMFRLRATLQRSSEPSLDLLVEAQIRLSQSEYFLRRFRSLEVAPNEEGWTTRSASIAGDVLKAHGEAFYYFAFRARQALRAIPGVDLNFKPLGVCNVRNQMIEHPAPKHGLIVTWWETDCPEGLILSPGGVVGQQGWTDKGLYPNAQEFIEKLIPKLEAALSSLQSKRH